MRLALTAEQTFELLTDPSVKRCALYVDDLFGEMGDYVNIDKAYLAALIRQNKEKGWSLSYCGTIDDGTLFLEPGD